MGNLTEADRAFLAATASLDAKKHKHAICMAFQEAYGPAAVGVTDRQIVFRFNRMREKNDAAKDFLAGQGALATAAVREVAVRTATVAVENRARREEAVEDEKTKTVVTLERLKQVRLEKGIEWLLAADEDTAAGKSKLLDSASRIIGSTQEAPKFTSVDDAAELQQLEGLNQALKQRADQSRKKDSEKAVAEQLTKRLAETPVADLSRA